LSAQFRVSMMRRKDQIGWSVYAPSREYSIGFIDHNLHISSSVRYLVNGTASVQRTVYHQSTLNLVLATRQRTVLVAALHRDASTTLCFSQVSQYPTWNSNGLPVRWPCADGLSSVPVARSFFDFFNLFLYQEKNINQRNSLQLGVSNKKNKHCN
jgi:hypothetical protein